MKTARRMLVALAIVFAASIGSTQAAIVESISFDLSPLHAGSTLSGTFALSDSPVVGDTASVVLSFSDPADYSPTSLTATITIRSGVPSGFAIDFSPLAFTNLTGVTTPINTRDVLLTSFALATCSSFPCTSTGSFHDGSPALFGSTYTITPTAAVPEPATLGLLALGLTGIAFARRRRAR